jgi:hypothetical protein
VAEFEWRQKEEGDESELKPSKKTSRRKWMGHKKQHNKHDKSHSSIRQMIEDMKAKKRAEKDKDETQEEPSQLSKGQRIRARFSSRKHLKAEDEDRSHHR